MPLMDGETITAFFGIALDESDIKFAKEEHGLMIFNTNRLSDGEQLTVVRDPLTVLRAAENGDTQVVAVFTDYTPDALRRIASLMESKKIETAELL